jgi:predicted enzyme related to lactoylglutathione lyase
VTNLSIRSASSILRIVASMADDVDKTRETITPACGQTMAPAFVIPEHKMRMAYAADPEEHTIELMKMD